MKVNNFTLIESEYGKVIVNRHCAFQAEALIKTGRPHIQDELNNLLAIARVLPDGCTVVDAGANIGLVTLPLAGELRPRGGTVHAFEVQRLLFYALCGSVALNDLDNVLVHNRALGAAPGTLKIELPDYAKPQDFGQLSLVDQSGNSAVQVEVTTIDGLGLPGLDLLKIDVEGMEIEVLRGARASIAQHLPWCWVEYWKVSIDDIKAQFADLDYRFFVVDSLNLLCAPRSRLEQTGLNVTAPET